MRSVLIAAVALSLACSVRDDPNALVSKVNLERRMASEPLQPIQGYPGTERQWTSQINIGNGRKLNYWYFDSRSNASNDPLVIWITGDSTNTKPAGLSAAEVVLFDNGPARVNKDGTLVQNPFSLNSNANVVYLDQPQSGSSSSAQDTAKDIHAFVKQFRAEHPELHTSELHLGGQSYAGGHYVPAAAAELVNDPQIQLTSVIIGSGIVDPFTQASSYLPMACGSGNYPPLVDNETCARMSQDALTALQNTLVCYGNEDTGNTCAVADQDVQRLLVAPVVHNDLNPWDLSRTCDASKDGRCYYELDRLHDYYDKANFPSTNVDQVALKQTSASGDVMQPYHEYISLVLDKNVPVLVYNGDQDYLANWIGAGAWTNMLNWNGALDFRQQSVRPWVTSKGIIGSVKTSPSQNLVVARVDGAGHHIAHDQPENTQLLLQQWLAGERNFDSSSNTPVIHAANRGWFVADQHNLQGRKRDINDNLDFAKRQAQNLWQGVGPIPDCLEPVTTLETVYAARTAYIVPPVFSRSTRSGILSSSNPYVPPSVQLSSTLPTVALSSEGRSPGTFSLPAGALILADDSQLVNSTSQSVAQIVTVSNAPITVTLQPSTVTQIPPSLVTTTLQDITVTLPPSTVTASTSILTITGPISTISLPDQTVTLLPSTRTVYPAVPVVTTVQPETVTVYPALTTETLPPVTVTEYPGGEVTTTTLDAVTVTVYPSSEVTLTLTPDVVTVTQPAETITIYEGTTVITSFATPTTSLNATDAFSFSIFNFPSESIGRVSTITLRSNRPAPVATQSWTCVPCQQPAPLYPRPQPQQPQPQQQPRPVYVEPQQQPRPVYVEPQQQPRPVYVEPYPVIPYSPYTNQLNEAQISPLSGPVQAAINVEVQPAGNPSLVGQIPQLNAINTQGKPAVAVAVPPQQRKGLWARLRDSFQQRPRQDPSPNQAQNQVQSPNLNLIVNANPGPNLKNQVQAGNQVRNQIISPSNNARVVPNVNLMVNSNPICNPANNNVPPRLV